MSDPRAEKMRRRSVEREEMAKNTPHEAHKRVLSVGVFGYESGQARTASGLGTPPTASG